MGADSVSDNFNRAEDSSLGANWSVLSATTIGVKTNAAYFGDSWGAGEPHVARYATLLNSLDHYSQATTVLLPSTGYGDIRLFARLIDVSNFYYWRIDNSSEWYLVRVNGGTETDLQGPIAAGTFSSTDVWKLEVTGTGATVSLKVYKNGTQQGSTYSDTSGSRHVTGAYVGIGGYTAGGSPSDVKIDDFSGGIVTAGSSVTGTAVGNFGFTGTVTGTPDVAGVIASSFGFTGTAIGTPDVSGVAVGNYSFTGTAIGQPGNDGTAVGDFGFTGTAVGAPGKNGVAGSSFGFTGTATVHDDILFSSNRTGNYEIYRRYPDGTVVQLTNNTSYDSFWPRSSPDGTKILFVRSAVGFHDTDITKNHTWTMNRDGSSQTNILPLGVDSWAVQGHPWWSPDGTKIVTMGGAVDLYTCNADGSSRALLTTTGQSFGLSDPSYTPDGTKILYCYGGNIWYVPAAGGTPTAVTTGTHEYYDPTADSASTTVAFLDHSSGNPVADWNIKTININGTGLTTVIADGSINSRPEWGKGDDFLYFHRNPPASGETGTFSIYKIRPNGTGLTPVLTGAGSSVSEYPGLTKVVANTGTAASLFGFTGTVVGTPDKAGTASGVFSFTATAVGTPDVAGTISTSFGFTGTAVGTPDVAGVLVGNFGFTGTAVGTGGAGGTAVTGTGVGSFGFTGVAVGKRQKWEDYTHNFPGSSGYDNTFFNAPYGDTPTVGSNKMTFPAATSTYSGIQTSISKSLIGSYFLVQLDPRSTGGYSGFSVKDAGTNADILQISYRAQSGVLEGKYYGSNWSDTDSSSTPAFTATTVWFRASESSGIVYLDKYVAGSGWVTVHADVASASALTALANCKIELNCGPFGTAMTTGPSFANINIPPSDNPVGSSNFGFTATAVGTKEVAGTIATNFGFTATARTVGNDITGTAVGSFGFTARVLIPGGATQSMKVWNGSAWLNGVMKVYNGTSWVTGSPRVWDGTNWIPAGGSSGGTTGGETLMSVMLQSMTKPHEGTLDGVPSGYDWASGPRIGASQPATAAYINGWGEAYTSGGNIPANVHVEIRNLKCAILVDGTWSVVQSQLPEGTLQPEGAYFLANFAANESKSGTYIEDGVFKGTPHTTPEDGKIWNMHFWTTPRAAIPVGNVDAVACWFEARLAGTGDIANSHVLVGAGVDWYETATTGYLGDACIGHHAFLTGEWTTHLAHSRGLNIATNPPPVALPYNPGVWEFPFNTVKIMPLGDSITGFQATDSTGWTTMTSRLAAQGITITTVGSQTDGYGGLRHEGHGGWCLDNTANACFHPPSFQAGGINDNIVSWLNTYDPQIIVLNAGANDAFTGRETQLGDFLDTCLDLIHATKPNAYVLVARPKSWSDIPNDNAVDIGGRSAEQLDVVAAKQALGYNVRAFNAYTSFTGASTSDWRDYIHPSAQGVGKMMDNTYAAILQLVDLNAV